RQLGARLADRLGGDNTNRLAEVDHVATGQVATVAVGADAEGRFAGDRRAHVDRLDAGGFQLVDPCLVQQGVAGDDRVFVVARQVHVFGDDPAQHAVAQRLDHVAAFHDRGHGQAVVGTAVGLGDHDVLGHVDQAAGQV